MSACQSGCGCSAVENDDAPASVPSSVEGTSTSLFAVPKMDCPSEERMIRLALQDAPGLAALAFDLGRREVRVVHAGPIGPIAERLAALGLGATLVSTEAGDALATDGPATARPSPEQEARTLRMLLAINAAMFVVELAAGWLARSTGLIADSLDMFADAAIYGLALHAVGRDPGRQLRAARLSGWLQALLAAGTIAEVARRFAFGSEPEPPLMMGIALVALAANVACLALISRHRDGGAHMKASWIFSTTDVLANLGVVAAGALVAWTGSNAPDLVIGALIAAMVLNGARRILSLRA